MKTFTRVEIAKLIAIVLAETRKACPGYGFVLDSAEDKFAEMIAEACATEEERK